MGHLTGKQKRYLRAQAVNIEPVVQIGKNDLDDAVVESARLAIRKRELIKVKLNQNSSEDRKEVMSRLANELKAELVQVIGNNGVIFRQKKKDSKYDLPK